ncbi:MAG: YceI family protein [Bacteroidia bacterium]
MKTLIISLFVLFYGFISDTDLYKSTEGQVAFFSEAPLENIDALNQNVSSVINANTKEVAFQIPIRGFKFKKALMEEHFNEKYMESNKYPDATFNGKINEDINFAKDGEYKITATGQMTIHGVEKKVTHAGTLSVKSGKIELRSAFNVVIKDYNIEIPTIVFQHIADTIAVKLNVSYLPYKKPN